MDILGIKKVCLLAEEGGCLEMLGWAGGESPWNEKVCLLAAKGANFSILKWARENGCPWNECVCFLVVKKKKCFEVCKRAMLAHNIKMGYRKCM
jgi:hypothetical protein